MCRPLLLLLLGVTLSSSTLAPNSPIEKKEISNDRARPMKAYLGFDSLAKRAYYSASLYYSTEEKAPY